MFLATLLNTVSPTPFPSVTPSPTPLPTPEVAHALAQATQSSSWLDSLNVLALSVSQPDVIVAGGILAVAVQSWLNKLPIFTHTVKRVQDLRRFALAVVVPFAMTAGASLASGHNTLGVSPAVFLVGQVLFYAFFRKSSTPQLPRTANP